MVGRGRPGITLTREEIQEALDEVEGVKTDAARIRGCSYTTFMREYRKYFTEDGFDSYKGDYNLNFLDESPEYRRRAGVLPLLNKFKVDVDKGNHIKVIAFGDQHYGHKNCQKVILKEVLQWMYDHEEVYVLGMGDYAEASIIDSPGLFDQETFLDSQFYDVVKMFQPLAEQGRLLGLHSGNHEDRVKRKTGLDITKLMCQMLGVKYFGEGMLHEIKVRNTGAKNYESYIFYTTHGSSSAWYLRTKMQACIRLSSIADADVYCMGHVHALGHQKLDRYLVENGRVVKRPRHFVLTGSYLTYWGSYAQMKGYPPSGDIGSPKIKLHTDKFRVSVSL